MDKKVVTPKDTTIKPIQPEPVTPKVTTKIEMTAEKNISAGLLIAGVAMVIMVGVAIGYVLTTKSGGATLSAVTGGKVVKSDKVVGSLDEKAFPDSTEGVLEKGGIDGEGTHQLIRDGGPSKTAYLTSSVIDLDQFVGKKVKVWGETRAAQKAGWLMDVGRLEILE